MEFVDFTCSADDADKRLDKVVKKILVKNKVTDTNVYKLLRKGLVKINGSRAREESKTAKGDVIQIASFLFMADAPEPSETPETEQKKISSGEILFENENILVVNKEPGINVQPAGSSEDSLSGRVLAYLGKSASLSFTPGPLRRLDKGTSGAVVFSKSLAGARWFSEKIQEHEIKKTYLAVVENEFEETGKEIHFEDFMTDADTVHNNTGHNNSMQNDSKISGRGFHTMRICAKDDPGGKLASTYARPVRNFSFEGKKLALVEFRIETGRKHQIRCQSAFHGHPLFGDTVYGGSRRPGFFLHAWILDFGPNPVGLPEKIQCPLPKGFSNFLEKECK